MNVESEMTERQRKGMADRVEEAKRHGVEMSKFTPWDSNWHGRFAEEARPGRGHDFSGVWCDGEDLVQISLDVYGNGYMAIANVNWIHADEDCECEVCKADRAEEDDS